MFKSDSNRTIVFNEFLKFNDGILIDYICKEKNVSKSEATKEIKHFVDNINKSLVTEKRIILEQIGELYLDENGKIQMKSEFAEEIKPEAKVNTEREKVTTTENMSAATQSSFVPKDNPEKRNLKEELQKAVEELRNESFTQPSEVQRQEAESQLYSSPRKDRSRFRLVFVIVVFILFTVTVIYFAFIHNSEFLNQIKERRELKKEMAQQVQDQINGLKSAKESKPMPKATESKPIQKPVQAVQQQVPPKEKKVAPPVRKEKIAPPQIKESYVASSGSKKYHLIVGCFVIKRNAEQMKNTLLGKGLSARIVCTRGEYTFVGLSSHNTKEEAQTYLKTLHKEGFPNAWILKY